jgi:putative colanic acid biosynthesis acetyltransferase WcaF
MIGEPAAQPAPLIAQTRVLPPRLRTFLPQSRSLRLAAAFWSITYRLLFRVSPQHCDGWRRMVLRLFGADIHRTATIHRSAYIRFPWNLKIEADVVVAHRVIFDCMGPIEIGARTHVSQYAHLCSGTHEYERYDMRIKPCSIRVGQDVWLAADSFIGPGVTVGDRSIVGACASVFKDLPSDVVAVGTPARPIRQLQRPTA